MGVNSLDNVSTQLNKMYNIGLVGGLNGELLHIISLSVSLLLLSDK